MKKSRLLFSAPASPNDARRADYRTNSVSDEKAKKLADEYVSVRQAEANLTTSFVPKLNKALPAKKVARYLQIENKIRAVIKYDLAATVPLVQ